MCEIASSHNCMTFRKDFLCKYDCGQRQFTERWESQSSVSLNGWVSLKIIWSISCSKQGSLQTRWGFSGPYPVVIWDTQEWRLHIHPGQPVTVLNHSQREKAFPNIKLAYFSPKDVLDVSHPFMVCSKRSLALFPSKLPIIVLKTAINPALAFSLKNWTKPVPSASPHLPFVLVPSPS